MRNILAPVPSRFISGDCTTHQLLNIYHMVCEVVDDKNEVHVVFCDISTDLDRAWHEGLFFKLTVICGSRTLLLWFNSYFSGRR